MLTAPYADPVFGAVSSAVLPLHFADALGQSLPHCFRRQLVCGAVLSAAHFVNLAMVEPGSEAERARLLLMARKLLRFSTVLAVPALALGLTLWLYYGVGLGPGNGWMHAKLVVVILTLGYHHLCARILRQLEVQTALRSHVWFRWFNEIPVLFLVAAVLLAVLKPF